jgi:hypothetical protein
MSLVEPLYDRSTQRVLVRCGPCGRVVIELRDALDADGEAIIGISHPASQRRQGARSDWIAWQPERNSRELHKHAWEAAWCPKHSHLTPIAWRELWNALAQARNANRPVTIHASRYAHG